MYTWANKITQHSGFSLEVPYHFNFNVLVCRIYMRKKLNFTK